jgi:agmatine deiminase
MIKDSDTNFVYLSELLKSDSRFPGICTQITSILDQHQIGYDFIKETKDIWVRDFMPIQLDKDLFVQFRYEPSYLKDELWRQSDPKIVCAVNNRTPEFSKINLDGGNIIKWYDKAIISKRVIKENPGYNETKLVDELEKLLGVKVMLIPDINPAYDMTGHADGYVRFLDDKTILINALENEFEYWKKDFQKMIKQTGFDYVEIPWFEDKDKQHPYSALGIYLNYLEIGNLIILPVFGIEGNKDQLVLDQFKGLFPNKHIEPININSVGKEGGLMNCITWNIKI